jgi:hypothetical protein
MEKMADSNFDDMTAGEKSDMSGDSIRSKDKEEDKASSINSQLPGPTDTKTSTTPEEQSPQT